MLTAAEVILCGLGSHEDPCLDVQTAVSSTRTSVQRWTFDTNEDSKMIALNKKKILSALLIDDVPCLNDF